MYRNQKITRCFKTQATPHHYQCPPKLILKLQLCNDSSLTPLEKRLLWAAFTLAFYGFLRANEFASSSFTWQHIHLSDDRYTILIEQSKTDPFRQGHIVNVHATGTSTCPVRALRLYAEARTPLHDDEPVFKGGKFSPLDRQHLTSSIRYLLKNTQYSHQQYSSHSFRSGAATTAAAAGIPEWLIKILGRWRSNAYQVYIHSSPAMLYSPYHHCLLVQTSLTQTQHQHNSCYCSYGMLSYVLLEMLHVCTCCMYCLIYMFMYSSS